jgi:transposase-like protein
MSEMPLKTTASQADSYGSWEETVKELIVEQMYRKRLSYKELAKRLEQFGIDESADQINRKVNRKKFTAAFLLACLAAMDVKSIRIM